MASRGPTHLYSAMDVNLPIGPIIAGLLDQAVDRGGTAVALDRQQETLPRSTGGHAFIPRSPKTEIIDMVDIVRAASEGAAAIGHLVRQCRSFAGTALATLEIDESSVMTRADLAWNFTQLLDRIDEIASAAPCRLLAANEDLILPYGTQQGRHRLRACNLTTGRRGLSLQRPRYSWQRRSEIEATLRDIETAQAHARAALLEFNSALDIIETGRAPQETGQPNATARPDRQDAQAAALTAQVREQLANTSLGLANPLQQSILDLF